MMDIDQLEEHIGTHLHPSWWRDIKTEIITISRVVNCSLHTPGMDSEYYYFDVVRMDGEPFLILYNHSTSEDTLQLREYCTNIKLYRKMLFHLIENGKLFWVEQDWPTNKQNIELDY